MKTKITISYLTLIVLSTLFLFNSCGKSSNNSSNPTTTNSTKPTAAATATIENFAFSPAVVHVLPGGSVTWTNKDATAHTVTDVNGAFNSGNIAVDGTYKFTFPNAGTYTYKCLIHSMMATATVVVGN